MSKKQTSSEKSKIAAWIASIEIPQEPAVRSEESKAIISKIKQGLNATLNFAAKANNLPF